MTATLLAQVRVTHKEKSVLLQHYLCLPCVPRVGDTITIGSHTSTIREVRFINDDPTVLIILHNINRHYNQGPDKVLNCAAKLQKEHWAILS